MKVYKIAIADLNNDIGKINGDLIPVYCYVCKKHMKGVKAGYKHHTTSHSYCPDCLKSKMEKSNANT
tara:strand:+ start:67476 stop:67676 length:201 start_codon:yes stop_codon:yes gene_type:complete